MQEHEKGKCEYCGNPGEKRAGPEDGLPENAYACSHCWKLLQSPVTGPALLRGHLALGMRGVVAKDEAEGLISALLRNVSGWRPRPPSS